MRLVVVMSLVSGLLAMVTGCKPAPEGVSAAEAETTSSSIPTDTTVPLKTRELNAREVCVSWGAKNRPNEGRQEICGPRKVVAALIRESIPDLYQNSARATKQANGNLGAAKAACLIRNSAAVGAAGVASYWVVGLTGSALISKGVFLHVFGKSQLVKAVGNFLAQVGVQVGAVKGIMIGLGANLGLGETYAFAMTVLQRESPEFLQFTRFLTGLEPGFDLNGSAFNSWLKDGGKRQFHVLCSGPRFER